MIKNILLTIQIKLKHKITDISYLTNYALETILNIILFYKQKQVTIIVLLRQVLFTGLEALWLISLNAFLIGSIIIIQGNLIFPNFGSSTLLYKILITVVTRELGTLLPALIIISRSGTAISTEIGNMVLKEEVDALLSFGISPFSYLIVPRVVGVVVSMITLSIYFNIFAILGSGIVAQLFYDIGFSNFISRIITELEFQDLFIIFIKSAFFGFSIAIISTYHGFKVSSASTEIPQRTTKAVVHSISTIIIIDVLLTILFYV
ncbi:MAG: ABC transporter permease [bacterium]